MMLSSPEIRPPGLSSRPAKGSVPGATATISPTQRDLNVLAVDEHGRMNWQKASGYNTRSKVEAAISRYKRVIGDFEITPRYPSCD
jgi:hypothetical protein